MRSLASEADLLVTHPLAVAGVTLAEKKRIPWTSSVLAPMGLMSVVDPPLFAPAPWVNPSLGAKSVEDFVRMAKSRPKQINYSSGGNGHATHLEMEFAGAQGGHRARARALQGHRPFAAGGGKRSSPAELDKELRANLDMARDLAKTLGLRLD